MMESIQQRNKRQIATWLLIGVGMIVVQVLLGGITRLTESGLSITEWKPITGALPPITDQDWSSAFDKYRMTDQFKYVHKGFGLSDFKFIFFWEWFHRLWARMMGMVFLVGFVYFIAKKKFDQGMIRPMVILFILGGLQGAIGWIMVKSGLVPEMYFVGHIQLATHFIAALGLLSYTLWFALGLMYSQGQWVWDTRMKKGLLFILMLLVIQLTYGAFMAGLKAAIAAPTWPSINGAYFPTAMHELHPWMRNLFYNPIMIHFIHRGVAYVLSIFIAVFWFSNYHRIQARAARNFLHAMLIVVLAQVVLGVATVLNATFADRLVFLGVAHQFTAMLLLCCVVSLLFLMKSGRQQGSL